MKKLLMVCVLLAASTAQANALTERCGDDPLQDHLLEGRLQWLRNCGYLQDWQFNFMIREREYPTYTRIAANDPSAACFDIGEKRGPCIAVGCYAPGQRLLFGGKYVAIDEAYTLGLETISTLGSADLTRPLHMKEMAISSFVSGDTKEELITLETEGGSHLKVTKTHPVFDDSGVMVIANKLEAGKTRILTLRGPELVTSVKREMYEGKVWNIKPDSDDYSDNVVVAEDILTGSIRFQNQWAELKTRFLHRDGEQLRDAENDSEEEGE